MKSTVTNGVPQWLCGLVAIGAMSGLTPARAGGRRRRRTSVGRDTRPA